MLSVLQVEVSWELLRDTITTDLPPWVLALEEIVGEP
jgi:hypothetical protein